MIECTDSVAVSISCHNIAFHCVVLRVLLPKGTLLYNPQIVVLGVRLVSVSGMFLKYPRPRIYK